MIFIHSLYRTSPPAYTYFVIIGARVAQRFTICIGRKLATSRRIYTSIPVNPSWLRFLHISFIIGKCFLSETCSHIGQVEQCSLASVFQKVCPIQWEEKPPFEVYCSNVRNCLHRNTKQRSFEVERIANRTDSPTFCKLIFSPSFYYFLRAF